MEIGFIGLIFCYLCFCQCLHSTIHDSLVACLFLQFSSPLIQECQVNVPMLYTLICFRFRCMECGFYGLITCRINLPGNVCYCDPDWGNELFVLACCCQYIRRSLFDAPRLSREWDLT